MTETATLSFPESVVKSLMALAQPGDIRQDVLIQGDTFQPRYISPLAMIRKLNHVFGFAWSDEIVGAPYHSPDHSLVMVTVKLTAYLESRAGHVVPIVKHGIGQARLKVNNTTPNGPTYQDYAYDVKAAHTDGLRKAATKFGIGLEAYEKDESAFQGLQRVPTPPQDVNLPAPGFQVANVAAMFEQHFKLPRQEWVRALGLVAPEHLTVAAATAICAGTHPYVVHLNGGIPLTVQGITSSNA